jgi:hypothetical protein
MRKTKREKSLAREMPANYLQKLSRLIMIRDQSWMGQEWPLHKMTTFVGIKTDGVGN